MATVGHDGSRIGGDAREVASADTRCRSDAGGAAPIHWQPSTGT